MKLLFSAFIISIIPALAMDHGVISESDIKLFKQLKNHFKVKQTKRYGYPGLRYIQYREEKGRLEIQALRKEQQLLDNRCEQNILKQEIEQEISFLLWNVVKAANDLAECIKKF